MKKQNFIKLYLLLIVASLSTMIFNSCDEEDAPSTNETENTDPDIPTNPTQPDDPSQSGTITVTSISLDGNEYTIPARPSGNIGSGIFLRATVLPDNASDKTVTWTSSNTSVITVSPEGITNTAVAKGAGTATITAQAGNKTATCVITVEAMPTNPGIGTVSDTTDPGVLIGNTRWATRNVNAPNTFANTPEKVGMLYQWNINVGWSIKDPLESSNGNATWKKRILSTLPATWGSSNNPCPAGWRLPTKGELNMGLSTTVGTWTTQNGVQGRMFGSDNNTIFFPAVSARDSEGKVFTFTSTSSGYWAREGSYLLIFAGNPFVDGTYADNGYCVRCVAKTLDDYWADGKKW